MESNFIIKLSICQNQISSRDKILVGFYKSHKKFNISRGGVCVWDMIVSPVYFFIGSGFIAPATLFSINEQVLQVHCGHETMIVYLVQQFLYEDVESSTSYMLFKQLHGEKSTKPLHFVFIPHTTLRYRGL